MRQLACLALLLSYAVATTAEPAKDPDIGLDYRALVRDQVKLISEAKTDDAIELLAKASANPEILRGPAADAIRKRFDSLAAKSGKSQGQEVAAYKRLTSRLVVFYAVAYFEKGNVTLVYTFQKFDAGWRLANFTISDGVEELSKVVPATPLGPARD